MNERIERTKKVLLRYERMQAFLKNAKADIADYEAMLGENPGAKTPGYGVCSGGGSGNMSEEERALYINEETRQKMDSLRLEVARVEFTTKRVDRALGCLERADRAVLEGRYVFRYTWDMTGRHAQMSVAWCRKRLPDALALLADILFGPGDIPIPVDLFAI